MENYKAVLRVERIKNLSNLGNRNKHNERDNFKKVSIHIDEKRTGLNINLFPENPDAKNLVENKIKEYGLSRSDGSVGAEMILTASKDYFDKNYPEWKNNPDVLKSWIEKNKQFLSDKYGSKNVSAQLHLDEETPHIHAIIVPIAERRFVKRNGQEVKKLKINYSHFFGDKNDLIKQARNTGTTDDLKLGRLQSYYAEYMQELGLSRGIRKSEAKNISPAEYREQINNIKTADIKLNSEFTTISNTKDKINILLKGNYSNIIKSHKIAMAENFKKANKINEQNNALKIDLSLKENQINELQKTLTGYENREAKLMQENKEYVQNLRDLSINDVCEKLEISENLKNNIIATFNNKKFNSIDFVMKAYDLNFKSAVSLLSEKYPQEQLESAVNNKELNYIKQETKKLLSEINKNEIKERKPIIQSELVKQDVIYKQLSALQADNYRITLMHESKPSFNLGKNKEQDGNEKFFNKDEILDKYIPYLSVKNNEGYNIFITPKSQAYDYILIDDARMSELEPFKQEFCLIQKSSENSYQAIALIEKGLNKEILNAGFKALNEKYGDPNISAQTHPFRLAGFTNRKQKYKDEKGNYPFAKLIQAIEVVSSKVRDFVKTNGMKIISQNLLKKWDNEKKLYGGGVSKIEFEKYYKNIKTETDLSVIDFKVALVGKEKGLNQEQIENIIKELSPDLAQRHPNINNYVDLTVKNVFSKTPEQTVKKSFGR
jgi:Plasmid recombination enzyme.